MRKKLLAILFAAALAISLAVPLIGGVDSASADAGGCPNAASANGDAHADDNSAHGDAKQVARGC